MIATTIESRSNSVGEAAFATDVRLMGRLWRRHNRPMCPSQLRFLALVLCGLAMMEPAPAGAQTAPTIAEAAAYAGLHAAAQRGQPAQLLVLAAAGADLDARDRNGRTPLHVATFARQREAIRALSGFRKQLHAVKSGEGDLTIMLREHTERGSPRIHLPKPPGDHIAKSRAAPDAGELLIDETNAPPHHAQLTRPGFGHPDIVDCDLPAGHRSDAVDTAQQRGLTRAAPPNDCNHLPISNGE